jgi:hypothetical protein
MTENHERHCTLGILMRRVNDSERGGLLTEFVRREDGVSFRDERERQVCTQAVHASMGELSTERKRSRE